jgi:hypothetical protein
MLCAQVSKKIMALWHLSVGLRLEDPKTTVSPAIQPVSDSTFPAECAKLMLNGNIPLNRLSDISNQLLDLIVISI